MIWERQRQERHRDLLVREVELKTLAHWIAASAGHEDGVAAVSSISLTGTDDDKPVKRELKPIPTSMIPKMFG